MNKIKLFSIALIALFSLCLMFGIHKVNSQSASQTTSTGSPDTFTINVSGNTLSSTTALNIMISISPSGSANLDTSLTFKGTGATQLLTDVNQGTGTLSVVWNGTLTNNSATITGMLKPGTASGTPVLTITKIEKAGGIDITKEVVSSITTSSSTPAPTPTPTPTPTPKPTPTPTEPMPTPKPIPTPIDIHPTPTPLPSPSPEDTTEPGIVISGTEEILLQSDIVNAGKLKVKATDFGAFSKCTVNVSDSDLLRVKPKRFLLGPGRTRQTIILRVPSAIAGDIIDNGDQEAVTIEVSCKNGAFDDTEVLLIPDEQ